MEPSCPLGTTRCVPQAKLPRKPYNKGPFIFYEVGGGGEGVVGFRGAMRKKMAIEEGGASRKYQRRKGGGRRNVLVKL